MRTRPASRSRIRFRQSLTQLVSDALPYLDGIGLVVLRIQSDLSEWAGQLTRRDLTDIRTVFPVSVEPLRVERGQLIYVEYTRSSEAGGPTWIYQPREDTIATGYVYIVYTDPVWGAERLCTVRQTLTTASLPASSPPLLSTCVIILIGHADDSYRSSASRPTWACPARRSTPGSVSPAGGK